MKYNFDSFSNRFNTKAVKWSDMENNPELKDAVPMWIADMDFDVLPEIKETLVKRAVHPIYGYTIIGDEVYDSITSWYLRRHSIKINNDEIVLSTGVVYSYALLIETLLKQDEKIIINTPCYPPFYKTPNGLNREVVCCPFNENNGEYTMNYEAFEKMLKDDPKIKMLDFCNPHNPLGIVWKKEDIIRIAEICHKYNIYYISDEIHSDFIMPGNRFESALQIKEDLADKLIVLGSPTKTFNLAGLKISYMIIKNKELKDKIDARASSFGINAINIFGLDAMVVAYKYGEEWLEQLLQYIDGNMKYAEEYIKKNMPKVSFKASRGTYLALVDLRKYNLDENCCNELLQDGHIKLNPGESFKADYRMLRMNFACPRSQVIIGLKNLKDWLEKNDN